MRYFGFPQRYLSLVDTFEDFQLANQRNIPEEQYPESKHYHLQWYTCMYKVVQI
jgi:hypothetical protein